MTQKIIDLLEEYIEMDKELCNNYIPIDLHLDTRIISWSKISKHLDLSHVPRQMR